MVKQIGTLELDEHLRFQKKMWVLERAAWILLTIVLLAAFLGFMGGYGFFNQRVAANQNVGVTYRPFLRRVAPTDVTVRLKDLQGGTAQLSVAQDYLNHFQVQQIMPQPTSATSDTQALYYEFTVPDGATAMIITFSLLTTPDTYGTIQGTIGQKGLPAVNFNQFVYP